jgi:uncharacterized cupin superfamily protein
LTSLKALLSVGAARLSMYVELPSSSRARALPPPNVHKPVFDVAQDRPPFSWRRARVGRQAGARELGASVYELPPGGSTFPLHVHHANEEILLVLAGRPTLRTLEGERELAPGDLVCFRTGRRGAHRVDNRGEAPARVLIVSTMIGPEVVEHVDSQKVYARSFAPGADAPEDAVDVMVRREDSRDFFEGEL